MYAHSHSFFAYVLGRCGTHFPVVDVMPGDLGVGDLIYKKNKWGKMELVMVNNQRADGYSWKMMQMCAGGICKEWLPDHIPHGAGGPVKKRKKKEGCRKDTKRWIWTDDNEKKMIRDRANHRIYRGSGLNYDVSKYG